MDQASVNAASHKFVSRVTYTRDLAVDILRHVPRLIQRDDCSAGGGNSCEKPVSPNTTTVTIVLATCIPTVVALGVLYYLHRRMIRRQRAEDANDRNFDLDFGIDEPALAGAKKKRKSLMFGEKGPTHKTSQLSMDMNLSSPYLLPPGIHGGSHDSIHSVVRTFPSEHDPYRPVAAYTNSEAGSVRSFGRDAGSMYSGGMNSKRASVITGRSVGNFRAPPPRQNSLPKSPIGVEEKVDPFATPTVPDRTHQSPHELDTKGPIVPVAAVIPEIDSVAVAYPDDKHTSGGLDMPNIHPPPRAAARGTPDGSRSPPSTQPPQFELPGVPHGNNNIGMASDGTDSFQFLPEHHAAGPAGLGLNLDLPQQLSPTTDAHGQSYDNLGYDVNHPQIQTSEYYEDDRGRSAERQPSVDYHDHQQGGLGVPAQNNKRLSIGVRPLPPDEVTESEDPEYRANRIRSFYKEYFDDSKEAAPPMPNQGQYYEDYDSGYLGDAAYYDADTNAFVMPYAQPVTRRAMTPPPGGRRGPPGPRGPGGPRRPRGPHGPHGSLGGMSMTGGGRPRAGSAFGPRGGYNSRAASSLGPRPDSSASGAWGRPKKNLPPPKALTTLPTPSKLKDDSFALMNAADFAPPDTFREHVSGRSQSPLGERRPYQPKVPSASPLVTAFDELAALPSPHNMRKSSTFTGLDFAPPKKFKDSDSMSDAGSIRSNRSGISNTQLSAIRGGAGRVSRLPGDTVFTQASVADQLKPSWNMRP